MLFVDGMAKNPVGTLQFLAQQLNLSPQQIFGAPTQEQIQAHIQERVQQELANAEVQRYEATAPEFYHLAKPMMKMLLENNHASDLKDAYRKAVELTPSIQSVLQNRRTNERMDRKLRAAAAGLNGAPHGVASAVKSNGQAAGSFGDIASDVRAAMQSLL
jgi:hypothetical protein